MQGSENGITMGDTHLSQSVEAEIEGVVRAELGRFGVERVEVVESEESDGTPSILVLAHYRAGAAPDPKTAAATITKVNDKLFELNEPRFAHISHRLPAPAGEPPRRRAQPRR